MRCGLLCCFNSGKVRRQEHQRQANSPNSRLRMPEKHSFERNHRQPQIAILLQSPQMGGAERSMLTLDEGLSRIGCQVDFLLVVKRGELLGEVPTAVRLIELGTVSKIRLLPSLIGLSMRTLRLLLPVMLMNRQPKVVRSLPKLIAYLRIAEPDALLTTRRRLRSRPSVGAAAGADHHAVYNGVDLRRLDELAASPVADPWFESDAPAVLMAVGRLAPQKDFRNLLEAFARVRSRRGVRLVILGKDRNAPVESLAADLGIAADVKTPAAASTRLRTWRARASRVVISLEGFGNVVEALACGCPIVSTDCPSGPGNSRRRCLRPTGSRGRRRSARRWDHPCVGVAGGSRTPARARPDILRARCCRSLPRGAARRPRHRRVSLNPASQRTHVAAPLKLEFK